FARSTTGQETAAILAKRFRVLCNVSLVSLGIAHVCKRDPIALAHPQAPCAKPRIAGQREYDHESRRLKFRTEPLSESQSPQCSTATPRQSISYSRPCTGGRQKCQVSPARAASRRTIS